MHIELTLTKNIENTLLYPIVVPNSKLLKHNYFCELV